MHRLQWLTLALLIVLVSASAQAVTWHVPSAQCPTIQSGLDSAAFGDTVLVALGIYYEHDIEMKSGARLLADVGDRDYAIIDAEGLGRVMQCTDCDASTRIEGFDFRNGSAEDGAGMQCVNSSPVISDCAFFSNAATGYGGGIYCDPESSSPTLTNCDFLYNTAEGSGGGMRGRSGTLTGCLFRGNSAYRGGGMRGSRPTLTNCEFTDNSASFGGGLYCWAPAAWLCRFRSNHATVLGGGVCATGGTLERCHFSYNTSDGGGGAVFCAPSGSTDEFTLDDCQFWVNSANRGGALQAADARNVTVVGCRFGRNTATEAGGAICTDGVSYTAISQCTLADNSAPMGGGIYGGPCEYAPTLTHTIIAFNTSGGGYWCAGHTPNVFCTDIYGNTGGDWDGVLAGQAPPVNGNMELDPQFCRQTGWFDYRLEEDSPCAEENNPECGHVGARSVGCPDSPVEAQESWGSIKAMFR